MFEVSVESSFTATHAVTISGVEEDQHDHEWNVVVTVSGERLDSDGLLVDFLELERQVSSAISPLQNTNLNVVQELDSHNPTAEHVAWYIAGCMQIPPPAVLVSVTVTEAPHCKATYRP
ncbi:MAG: 6-carboxytetrahydropterin synthase [Phycisphaerales bacterium]|jgi:6-pyruvoyltetrahydropterin/6-carboxytetrahydropterin synthase|nr:6-carboxytetrahydropterin synthase [Phycisphaerales bacterium]